MSDFDDGGKWVGRNCDMWYSWYSASHELQLREDTTSKHKNLRPLRKTHTNVNSQVRSYDYFT